MTVTALTRGSWPLQERKYDGIIPDVISEGIKLFTEYYAYKYSGRTLHFIPQSGRGEVVYSRQDTKPLKYKLLNYISSFLLFTPFSFSHKTKYKHFFFIKRISNCIHNLTYHFNINNVKCYLIIFIHTS